MNMVLSMENHTLFKKIVLLRWTSRSSRPGPSLNVFSEAGALVMGDYRVLVCLCNERGSEMCKVATGVCNQSAVTP